MHLTFACMDRDIIAAIRNLATFWEVLCFVSLNVPTADVKLCAPTVDHAWLCQFVTQPTRCAMHISRYRSASVFQTGKHIKGVIE